MDNSFSVIVAVVFGDSFIIMQYILSCTYNINQVVMGTNPMHYEVCQLDVPYVQDGRVVVNLVIS